ncbi:MAG: cisplatin damage response ATP-dependent DNA ligase [Pseudomonadota bacterium]
MTPFAELIERLVFCPSRNGKLRLLADYFARVPDPDRGWALAALTGGLDFPAVKAGVVRGLAVERVDPTLFGWSYDYVGDLAETVSLIWPERPGPNRVPTLGEVVETMQTANRSTAPALVAGLLDALDANERFALLKLITGGMRIGVSARLAKVALAQFGKVDTAEIEELWHGLTPPYEDLFGWLDGNAPKPNVEETAVFRPLMLAHPMEEGDRAAADPSAYRAEWKWDGIRVQVAARGGERRLYSRTGDDISGAFPDITEAMAFDAVLDGELLVCQDGEIQSFNRLQQRLNRKKVTGRMLDEHPAWVRLYDILFDGDEDMRSLAFDERRQRLEAWIEREGPSRMDLSPMIQFSDWQGLDDLRTSTENSAIEGVMVKRGDSPYVAGRPKGPWYKWKRAPQTLDTVLMYAQRGHGKRSSFYSDFTFGAWRPAEDGGRELVPVGKAYFGFTDEELAQLDKWVRANTTDRFGPVRAVSQELVLEVAFDSVSHSTRHKSGVAMRFPRISRIRWDKPASEADVLETLEALIAD